MSELRENATSTRKKGGRSKAVSSESFRFTDSQERLASLAPAIYGYFGQKNQVEKIKEEASELSAAAGVALGGTGAFHAFLDEIADLSILIAQFRVLYSEEIDGRVDFKLARLFNAITSKEGKYSKG
jgi:hypothetical protein